MFRYKSGIKVDHDRQGYIYFVSRMYKELSPAEQKQILDLCKACGGEYWRALFDFVTTDATATELELKHHLSRSTLYRAVRKYYESFPKKL